MTLNPKRPSNPRLPAYLYRNRYVWTPATQTHHKQQQVSIYIDSASRNHHCNREKENSIHKPNIETDPPWPTTRSSALTATITAETHRSGSSKQPSKATTSCSFFLNKPADTQSPKAKVLSSIHQTDGCSKSLRTNNAASPGPMRWERAAVGKHAYAKDNSVNIERCSINSTKNGEMHCSNLTNMPPEKNKHRNNRAATTAPHPTGAKAKVANSKQKSGNANPGSKPDQMEEDKEKRDDEGAVIEAVTLDTTAVEQCCDVKKCFEQDPESIMMMQKECKKLVGDDEDCYRHQDHPLLQEALARIHCKTPKTQVAPDPSQLQFVAQSNVPVHDVLVIITDVAQQTQKAIGFLEEAMVNELLTVTSRLAHTPPKNLFTVKKKMTESTIESACWWCANVTLGSWHAKENKHKRQKKDDTVKSKDIRNFINETNGADDTGNDQDQEEEKAGSDNDDGKANEPLQTPAKGKGTNRTDVESPQFQLSPKTKKKVNAEEVAKKRQCRSRFGARINIPDLTKTNKSATDCTSSTYKFRYLLLPPEVRTCNVCEINERPLALDAFFTNT